MANRREEVLLRLEEVLHSVAPTLGVQDDNVFRNRGDIPDEKTPSLVLLDGVWRVSRQVKISRRGVRYAYSPGIMNLMPSLWYICRPRPVAADDHDQLGPEMSQAETVIFQAVTSDAELFDLLSGNGWMEYLGGETDMQTGNLMEGELRLDFSLNYLLDPSEL